MSRRVAVAAVGSETSETSESTSDSEDDSDGSPQPSVQQAATGSSEECEETEESDEEEEGEALDESHVAPLDAAAAQAEADAEAEAQPELIELALEALEGEDVSPVVRLAFERAAPIVRAAAHATRRVSRSCDTQAVTNALEVIIERKVGEAQTIVAQSYREFVDSMGELRHVQARGRA